MRIEEWRKEIGKHFPEYVLPAEIGLSVICQLLVDDITNPFGLVYIDVPSSGKTIIVNFFSDIEELVYATDNFSQAAFVSHAVNVKKKDLAKVDLLPRIKDKMLIVRELSIIFGKREEELKSLIGQLTRVFDGEGLETDGGVHGKRGYTGDYLFMFLAASTPIPKKVWKLMGNFGSRLFFYYLDSPDKSVKTLAKQNSDSFSAKKKEKFCREVTGELINTIWDRSDCIYWRKEKDAPRLLEEIAIIAQLVACLRGTINVWKENLGEETLSHTDPQIEKPDRINCLLYNLARGHAVACGRESINDEDIAIVLKVALCSAERSRTRLFNKLIKSGGVLTTEDVMHSLKYSRPWALIQMETLKYLGIVQEVQSDNLEVGRSEKVIKITKQFSWFISNRFKELNIVADLVNK